MSLDADIQTLGAIAAAVAAIATYFNRKAITRNSEAIRNVHDDVNGNVIRSDARIDQLTKTLTKSGVDVPDRPTDASGQTPSG